MLCASEAAGSRAEGLSPGTSVKYRDAAVCELSVPGTQEATNKKEQRFCPGLPLCFSVAKEEMKSRRVISKLISL